mmetsp:Transcript_5873/g.22236  ORF Transcript_5873/g.22236 Transcript_5873/m.22236 type:complete len:262 (-) Transcript_5873:115-900(-)
MMNTLLVGAMASPMDSISTINEDEVFNVRNDRNTRNSRNTRNTITIPPLLKLAPPSSTAQSSKLKPTMTKSNLFHVAASGSVQKNRFKPTSFETSSTVNINKHSWLIGPSQSCHWGLSVSRPTARDATTIVKLMVTLKKLLCTTVSATACDCLMPTFNAALYSFFHGNGSFAFSLVWPFASKLPCFSSRSYASIAISAETPADADAFPKSAKSPSPCFASYMDLDLFSFSFESCCFANSVLPLSSWTLNSSSTIVSSYRFS